MPFFTKPTYLLAFLIPSIVLSQTDSTRYKFVEALAKDIKHHYINPDLAKRMADTITSKVASHRYDNSLNADEFAYEITKDLRRVSNDLHIVVIPKRYREDDFKILEERKFISRRRTTRYYRKSQLKFRAFLKSYNKITAPDMFSYGEIKILPGNIGYVEIKDFMGSFYSKKKNKDRISLESVMRFMKNTTALIVDFRENSGGRIDLAGKFCSYFAISPGTYFITTQTMFFRDSGASSYDTAHRKKWHTSQHITNRFTASKKIYLLTSNRTFSAGELATYKVRQFVRDATIVGERTSGGGNGHFGGTTSDHYHAVIPCIKIFDESKSKFEIEGHGVAPDIAVSADSAFATSYRLASSSSKYKPGEKTKYFKGSIRPGKEPVRRSEKYYADFTGDYNKIVVSIRNGALMLTYDSRFETELIPDYTDHFRAEAFEQVSFIRNESKLVREIRIKHKDGSAEVFRRR